MKKLFIKFKNLSALYIVICALFLIISVVYAINTVDTGYKSDPGAATTIDAHGYCKKVVNSGGNSYFIPTKTAAEWADFISFGPSLSGITLEYSATDHKSCYDNDEYWYDTCNNIQAKAAECGTSAYTGSNYCYDNDVYRDYVTKGCSGVSCTSSTGGIKQEECGVAGCSGGACVAGGIWNFKENLAFCDDWWGPPYCSPLNPSGTVCSTIGSECLGTHNCGGPQGCAFENGCGGRFFYGAIYRCN